MGAQSSRLGTVATRSVLRTTSGSASRYGIDARILEVEAKSGTASDIGRGTNPIGV
jgi:hypothetical protein